MATKRKEVVYKTGWCGGVEVDKAHDLCPYETTQKGLVCGCDCHENTVVD